jgi:CheY-specific phosphatase CheX
VIDSAVIDSTVIDPAVQRALARSVSEVLESMFFLEALEDSEKPVFQPSRDISVRLTFDGEPPGVFRMRLARPTADSIAANFLGEDLESLSARQSLDVALELANMICGAVLSRIESRVSFRLSAPEIVAEAEIRHTNCARETTYTVETGNGTLTLAIQMETRACPETEKFAY